MMPECPDWGEEVLLRETKQTISGLPVLQCSNCGFKADHFFWFDSEVYANMKVKWCPNCRLHILGVVGCE